MRKYYRGNYIFDHADEIKQNKKIIRLHSARGCLATGDLRFILVPYVSRLEEDFRPIIKYAIVDSLTGQVTKSGFMDESEAEAEVLSYYE